MTNKLTIIFTVLTIACSFQDCKSQHTGYTTDAESYDLYQCNPLSDTITYVGEEQHLHIKRHYIPFDSIPHLTQFFDSVFRIHPLTLTSPDDEDEIQAKFRKCISLIDAYRQGHTRYFPAEMIKSNLQTASFHLACYANHNTGPYDLIYIEWFMLCAAYYTPYITCLVDTQTPDHCAGYYNLGKDYNPSPWWAYLFLKQEKGYEMYNLGDFIFVHSLFQLEDEQHRKYYLCSNNTTSDLFNQWLFWTVKENHTIKVAECHNVRYPDDTGTIQYYFDSAKLIWKHCKTDEKSGHLIPLSDEPILQLTLDGKNSRFY